MEFVGVPFRTKWRRLINTEIRSINRDEGIGASCRSLEPVYPVPDGRDDPAAADKQTTEKSKNARFSHGSENRDLYFSGSSNKRIWKPI